MGAKLASGTIVVEELGWITATIATPTSAAITTPVMTPTLVGRRRRRRDRFRREIDRKFRGRNEISGLMRESSFIIEQITINLGGGEGINLSGNRGDNRFKVRAKTCKKESDEFRVS